MLNLINGTWSSLMSMFALSSRIRKNIVSAYPESNTFTSNIMMGKYILSRVKKNLFIWSQINNIYIKTDGKFTPNHFVPLVGKETTCPVVLPKDCPKLPAKQPTCLAVSDSEHVKSAKMIILDRKGSCMYSKFTYCVYKSNLCNFICIATYAISSNEF